MLRNVIIVFIILLVIGYLQVEKRSPDEELSLEEFLNVAVGEETNHIGYDEKVLDISQEGDVLSVDLIANDNLSSKLIREVIWLDSIRVFRGVFRYEGMEKVLLTWHFPFGENKEDTRLERVAIIEMKRKVAEDIDWDYFRISRLPRAASDYWVHEELE